MNTLSSFIYSLINFPLVIQDIFKYIYFKKQLQSIHEQIKERLIELSIYSFKINSYEITKIKEINDTPLLFHPEFENLMIRHGRLNLKQKNTHFAVLLSLYEEKEEVKQFAFQSGLKISDSRKIVDLIQSAYQKNLKEWSNSGKNLITNMSSLILFLLFSICYYISASLMTYIFVYCLFVLICNKRGN